MEDLSQEEFGGNDGFDTEISQRLRQAFAGFPETEIPTIEQLEARIQANKEARLVNRLKRFTTSVRTTITETAGFGHTFYDEQEPGEVAAKFFQPSKDSSGNTWAPMDRHCTQITAVVVGGGTLTFGAYKIANSLGLV